MNPTALVLFAFGSAVGYLVNGGTGAVYGFVITAGISLACTLFD